MAKKIANKSEVATLQGAQNAAAQALAVSAVAAQPAVSVKAQEALLMGKKKNAELPQDAQVLSDSDMTTDLVAAQEGESASARMADIQLAQANTSSNTAAPAAAPTGSSSAAAAPVAASTTGGIGGGALAAGLLGAVALAGAGGGGSTTPTPRYSLEVDKVSASEGQIVRFTLTDRSPVQGDGFDYVISGAGITADDVEGGRLSGRATIGADGKAVVEFRLNADSLTEGAETLTLTIVGLNLSKSLQIVDSSVDPTTYVLTDAQDEVPGNPSNNAIVGNSQTYNSGDLINGDDGRDTLVLTLAPGSYGDGVFVSNVEVLNLRAVEGGGINPVRLRMTDWDDQLEEINILDAQSNVYITNQKTLADVNLTDTAGDVNLDYERHLNDGATDQLNVSVNNFVGGLAVGDGVERISIDVRDDAEDFLSDMALMSADTNRLTVTGGESGQDFTLDADVAAGASLTSTAFAGDLILSSADIKTANLGAGSDEVTLTGQANLSDSSYNLGEGDNEFGYNGALGGDVSAGSGDDTVSAASAAAGSSINVGNGTNTVTVTGAVAGAIDGGTGEDTVVVGSTAATGDIDVGGGDNTVAVGGEHAGKITGGDGANDVSAASTAAGSQIELGDGGNFVLVGTTTNNGGDSITFTGGAHNGAISTGTGNDDIVVGATGANSTIEASDGDNRIIVGTVTAEGNEPVAFTGANHTGSIEAGAGDDQVWTGSVVGGSIDVGDGSNSLEVDGNVSNGTITVGDGEDNSLAIDNNVASGSSITIGDGAGNSLEIGNDVTGGSSITIGDGAGNSLVIDDDVQGGSSITLGDGAGNSLVIKDDLQDGSSVTFGDGAGNSFVIGQDLESGSSITLGDGGNTGAVRNNVSTGSTITFGTGDDALTIGAASDAGISNDPVISGVDVDTVINMGEGDDHVVLRTSGEDYSPNVPPSDIVVRSGAFVEGDGGDDTLTLRTNSSVDLIVRTEHQRATIDLSAESFEISDEVTVTFTRGEDTFNVTISADEVIQGPENLAAAVASALADALGEDENVSDDFDAEASDGVITITSDVPHEDWAITWHVNEGEPTDAVVDQISDARISSFETLELVALDTAGQDYTVIGANFDLIDGTNTVELESQVDLIKTTNEHYDQYAAGGITTFELTNLKGGEALHVSGNETSATGNRQVEKITVGESDSDHAVGDRITVTIGEETVEYIVTASDLAGDTAVIDAQNIATSLRAAILGTAEAAGFTVTRDGNDIWLVGSSDANQTVTVAHDRDLPNFVVFSDSESAELGASYDLNPYVGDLEVGDLVAITVGEDTFEYTITANDLDSEPCERSVAERISEGIAAAAVAEGLDVTANWGRVNFDGAFSILVTRTALVNPFTDKTVLSNVQNAAATDDDSDDVVVDASLAAGATDTTMDLTVHGTGAFDILIQSGKGEDEYTDLDLKLGDEFSHTIDTSGDAGIFADSITVSDLPSVDTAGQDIVLDYVLARTVDTSASAANFTIDQLTVRGEDLPTFAGETITVTTGTGDDHLTTLAQSAMVSESSIDLGSGENRLSLGWGEDYGTLNSADIEGVANINYVSNDLARVDILNDVELDAGEEGNWTTTLQLTDNPEVAVEDLTFTNLNTTASGLVIRGAAQDFNITSGDFDLNSGASGVFELLVQDGAGEAIEGDLNIDAQGATADAQFVMGNTKLDSLTVSAGRDTEVIYPGFGDIENEETATITVGEIDLSGGGKAVLYVNDNELTDFDVTGDLTVAAGDTGASALFTSNRLSTFDIGGDVVTTSVSGDAQFDIGANQGMQLTVEGELHMHSATSSSLEIVANSSFGETDSSIEFVGDIHIEGEGEGEYTYWGAAIDVAYNYRTNVSLAADGEITLISCDEDSRVEVALRSNANVVVLDDTDVSGELDYEIALGNLTLDSGFDATVLIEDNLDSTEDSDMLVTVGNVNATAYGEASVVLAFNDSTTVELGDVNLLAQSTASLDLYANQGQIYLAGALPEIRREIDYAQTTIGAVNLESTNADAWLWVSDSNLAIVDISDVDITAATDVDVYIGENGGEEGYYGEDQYNNDIDDDYFEDALNAGLEDVQINIASITTESGEDTTFSISNNSALMYNYGGLFFSDSTSTVEVTVGAIDITAGSDATFDISENDATAYGSDAESTMTIDIESLTVDAVGLASVDIVYNDAYASGDISDSGAGTSTVNVTLGPVVVDAGTDATLFIYSNTAGANSDGTADVNVSILETNEVLLDEVSLAVDLTASDSAWVDIDGNDASTGFYYGSDVDTSAATVTIELGNVHVEAGSDASFAVEYNDARASDGSAEVSITVGDVGLDTLSDAYLGLTDNNALAYENALSDSSTATTGVTLGAVDIVAKTAAYMGIELNDATTVSDGGTADVTIAVDTVDIETSDAQIMLNIYSNLATAGEDGSATVDIDVSDVTIDAGSYAVFSISDNDASAYGEDDAEVTVDVTSVDMTAATYAIFNISDNDASGSDALVDVTLGTVDIGASDNVEFTIYGNSDGAGTVNITVGDVDIEAGNDVYFVVDGSDSTDTTLGDVTVDAGLDAVGAVAPVSSDVYLIMNEVNGTESVTITADSHSDGDSDVYAVFKDMEDLSAVTVSGTNAELYFFGNIGSDSAEDDFTLDLSGMTGAFGEDAADYDPTGVGASASAAQALDDGTYVVNVDADFGAGFGSVIVKVGSGDLIYNAQHSAFGSDAGYANWYYALSDGDANYSDTDFTIDWNGDEGWYSLGDGLDLDVDNEVRTLTFGSGANPVTYGEDGTATFTIELDGKTYTIGLDYDVTGSDAAWSLASDDGVGGTLDAADLIAALGDGAAIDVSDTDTAGGDIVTVSITGNNDGSAVNTGPVSDLNSSDAAGDLVSDVVTTEGNTASDGPGNVAGEVFTFVGETIGEVVIGGFQPNGFELDISGEVDRIDLSAFTDIRDAGDLVISWDDTDGYFADIVIDFVDQDYGSIRLVGAGEFFDPTNVNGIANSIIFA